MRAGASVSSLVAWQTFERDGKGETRPIIDHLYHPFRTIILVQYFLNAEKAHSSVSTMEKRFWKFQSVKNIFPDAIPEKCKNFLTVEKRTIQRRGF